MNPANELSIAIAKATGIPREHLRSIRYEHSVGEPATIEATYIVILNEPDTIPVVTDSKVRFVQEMSHPESAG